MFRFVLSTAVVILGTASLEAQTFRAVANFYPPACTRTANSTTVAQVFAGCPHPTGAWSFTASARSSPAALEGSAISSLFATQGVPIGSSGSGEWKFTDVVFSDGSPGSNPISVQMSFTMSGTSFASSTYPANGFQLVVGSPFFWQSPNYVPGGSVNIVTPAFTVMTNTPVNITINAGCSSAVYLQAGASLTKTTFSLVWGDQTDSGSGSPFIVPAGVTVNSQQAKIQNNVAIAPPPAIAPTVSAGDPTLATGNLDVTFANGEPGSPGIYLFGAPPNGNGIGVTRWFSLDLPPSPLVSLPFVADGSGGHFVSIPLNDPSFAGISIGVQAAQVFSGPPIEAYGTNAWRIDIQ